MLTAKIRSCGIDVMLMVGVEDVPDGWADVMAVEFGQIELFSARSETQKRKIMAAAKMHLTAMRAAYWIDYMESKGWRGIAQSDVVSARESVTTAAACSPAVLRSYGVNVQAALRSLASAKAMRVVR